MQGALEYRIGNPWNSVQCSLVILFKKLCNIVQETLVYCVGTLVYYLGNLGCEENLGIMFWKTQISL